MFEQIEELAGRIEALVGNLEEARHRNEALLRENARLESALEGRVGVEARCKELEEQILNLEGQLEEMTSRESKIRERLISLLGRIESLEGEIQGKPGA